MTTAQPKTATCGQCGDEADADQHGYVNGWFALFRDGRRVDACSTTCLGILDHRLSITSCARDECRSPATAGHIYCTAECKRQDNYWATGAGTMMLTSGTADRLARVRRNLALAAGDTW